jgi:hypothetical protein
MEFVGYPYPMNVDWTSILCCYYWKTMRSGLIQIRSISISWINLNVLQFDEHNNVAGNTKMF